MVALLCLPLLYVSTVPPFTSVNVVILVWGLSVLLGGILWWRNQRTTYAIILTTSSGEIVAWQSADGSYVADLLAALNNAIVGDE